MSSEGAIVAAAESQLQRLRIEKNIVTAADIGAEVANRLAALAYAQLDKINAEEPMESQETLQAISALMKISNEAAKIAADMRKQEKPLSRYSVDIWKR